MRTGPTAELRPGHLRAWSVLRTARLNAVGYAALMGACLVAGAVTAVLLQGTGWPMPLRAALGPVLVVLALVVADRRKWARMETSFSFTDDVATMRAVADRLLAQGLPIRVRDEWGPSMVYRNGDARRVHAALAELGIRTR
jgi:hypothetical protein